MVRGTYGCLIRMLMLFFIYCIGLFVGTQAFMDLVLLNGRCPRIKQRHSGWALATR